MSGQNENDQTGVKIAKILELFTMLEDFRPTRMKALAYRGERRLIILPDEQTPLDLWADLNLPFLDHLKLGA